MLTPLTLPPGVRFSGTDLQAKGRWTSANFIRWVEGVMRPVGKWVRISQDPLIGRISEVVAHRDASNRGWLIVGTSQKIYAILQDDPVDITPDGFIPGRETSIQGVGFGAGPYGKEDYGTPRSSSTSLVLSTSHWSIDSWGSLVMATSLSDGRVFVWDPGTLTAPADAKMEPVPNAPEDNRSLIVTHERHLMLLGAGGNPRLIQWSSRENYTDWTPTPLNLAGDLLLETSGDLMAGMKVRDEVLVMSEVDIFAIRYSGQPYGYGRELVGSNCGMIGPKAAAVSTDFVAWMGRGGFYTYAGQVVPLDCDVWDYVFRDLNYDQRYSVTAGHNSQYNEMWWFFPTGAGSTNTRYVIWNYRENWWSVGELGRSAWQEKGIRDFPVASGEDGLLYEHERDLDAPGVESRPKPFIESSPFEVQGGGQTMAITQLMPDRDSEGLDRLKFFFKTRYTPLQDEYVYGPFKPDLSGYIPTRFSGRGVSLRVESDDDKDWRLGVLRADIKPGGKR